MKTSTFFIATQKEVPAEAEIASHRLMLRSSLIRRLSAGIYTWLPLGFRVLRKVEAVVRGEMTPAGAIELMMPPVQPRELWEQAPRWGGYRAELLRFKERHEHEFHVLAESGEDAIAFSPESEYAANVELAEALAPGPRPAGRETLRKVPTPGKTTCEQVAGLLGITLQRMVKAVAVMHDQEFIV